MKKYSGMILLALFAVLAAAGTASASMDFTALTTALTTEVGLALTAVVAVAALILGATVGYRVYKRFTH